MDCVTAEIFNMSVRAATRAVIFERLHSPSALTNCSDLPSFCDLLLDIKHVLHTMQLTADQKETQEEHVRPHLCASNLRKYLNHLKLYLFVIFIYYYTRIPCLCGGISQIFTF